MRTVVDADGGECGWSWMQMVVDADGGGCGWWRMRMVANADGSGCEWWWMWMAPMMADVSGAVDDSALVWCLDLKLLCEFAQPQCITNQLVIYYQTFKHNIAISITSSC